MEDQSLHSPMKPHFFQPLLPSFHTHLKIPIAFFWRHMQGINDHIKIAKLRSDASDKTWLVKIHGLKLTDGWEDFVVAHDLRVGDIIVFRHEGEMVFHVTSLGPSCCEIHYTSSSSHNISDDSYGPTNNMVTGNSSRDKIKRVKKYPRKKVKSSSGYSDHSRFVTNVTASSLSFDRLYLPRSFARSNGLDKMSGEKILLCNQEGRSWSLKLKYHKSDMHTFVKPGWRRFCTENGMSHGLYTFKLLQKSGPPVIRLCRAEHRPETGQRPVHSLCSADSNRGKALLECPEDSDDVESLSSDTSSGDKSSESEESENESLGDENISQVYLDMEKKMRCSASYTYSENQFVILTLTPYAVKQYYLTLPVGYTRVNGINKPGKITLLGQDGVRWVVDFFKHKRSGIMRFGKGWRDFCEAQGVKKGGSFVLELIWEEEASPVLKFCTKLNSV